MRRNEEPGWQAAARGMGEGRLVGKDNAEGRRVGFIEYAEEEEIQAEDHGERIGGLGTGK